MLYYLYKRKQRGLIMKKLISIVDYIKNGGYRKWIRVFLTGILIFSFLTIKSMGVKALDINSFMKAGEYENSEIANFVMPYRLYVPNNYDKNKPYAFLLYLHGSGGRGNDNQQLNYPDQYQIITNIITNYKYNKDFIILAPQCPLNMSWVGEGVFQNYNMNNTPESLPEKMVMSLIADDLTNKYNIDQSRMYITGISMGGGGTWDIICRNPDMFAAAMPICGYDDPSMAYRIKDVPIYTFHSADDDQVDVNGTRKMVDALKAIGGNIQYTEYPDQKHASWTKAYQDMNAFQWMMKQCKTSMLDLDDLNVQIAKAEEIKRNAKIYEADSISDLLAQLKSAKDIVKSPENQQQIYDATLKLSESFAHVTKAPKKYFLIGFISAGVVAAGGAIAFVITKMLRRKR